MLIACKDTQFWCKVVYNYQKKLSTATSITSFLILAGLIYFALPSCGDDKTPAATQEQEIKRSPELMLAILDAGVDMPENDIRVNAIRNYLEKVATQFNEPKDTIAEYTSRCQGMLHDHGIPETCHDILHNIFLAHWDHTDLKMKYKEVTVLYAMEKTNQ